MDDTTEMTCQIQMLKPVNSFIVVDTEGQDTLTEIAVLDHQGQLLYEAFAQKIHPQAKPLREILERFLHFSKNKWIVWLHVSAENQQCLWKLLVVAPQLFSCPRTSMGMSGGRTSVLILSFFLNSLFSFLRSCVLIFVFVINEIIPFDRLRERHLSV